MLLACGNEQQYLQPDTTSSSTSNQTTSACVTKKTNKNLSFCENPSTTNAHTRRRGRRIKEIIKWQLLLFFPSLFFLPLSLLPSRYTTKTHAKARQRVATRTDVGGSFIEQQDTPRTHPHPLCASVSIVLSVLCRVPPLSVSRLRQETHTQQQTCTSRRVWQGRRWTWRLGKTAAACRHFGKPSSRNCRSCASRGSTCLSAGVLSTTTRVSSL